MRMGRRYLSSGKGMHSVMNYYLIDALIGYFKYGDINTLRARLNEILTEYPDDTIFTLMNFSSTHDISRIIEIYGYNGFDKYGEWNWDLPKNTSYEWINEHHLSGNHYRHGKMVYKSHFFALAFLPGILSIFYGDEVGTQGIGNLANRAPFPWGKEDKDLLKFVRRTVKARNNNTFLRTAQTNIIKIDSEQFVFERYNNQNEGIWVCVSRTHHETNVDLPEKYRHGAIIAKIKGCDKNHLSPYGAIAIKK